MTLRYEQYKSLLKTKAFMRSLYSPHTRPRGWLETKREVASCLRHFPDLHENGQPIWSNDSLTKDWDNDIC